MNITQLRIRLDDYYEQIRTIILTRQNPITGLLPASTAVNAHGDYTDAWVRDNVYSILAVWGLGLAYRKIDDDRGRTYELEHSVVKLMRGLLFAMMRQMHKIERFKATQSPLDALHAKYDTHTGGTVVGDDEWGHLQLDATSLFLLMLAQMTASGLHIIFTTDEVNFIQNLVYYIGRAYRTPDYGIWERGAKINHGNPELNASSVGMAKAALEAMNGLDLFGVRGGQGSVIHVVPDEIARSRITLESLLPRESSSKEVDAALLSVIGYPAFAVENADLCDRTRTTIVQKLQGKYGCKRFLRDGHQTVIEDTSRLHYEPWELQQFEHIECEWPLFFTYLLLDGVFRGDRAQIDAYRQRLEAVAVEREGLHLLPELYYVPKDAIEAERRSPQSQPRLPNENLPLVWAQSLYLLGQLLSEGLLAVGDIDPLGRHLHIRQQRQPLVQVALLAEDDALQAKLAAYGIASQTPTQVESVQVRQAKELVTVYAQIGRNNRLGLTGRPERRLRSLMTSRVFRVCGEAIVFLPSLLDSRQFYLTFDPHFLVTQIRAELAHIQRHWSQLGRPTLTLLLTHTMLEADDVWSEDAVPLLTLIQELKSGLCNGVQVRLGQLNQLLLTAGTERIDFLHDFKFTQSPVQDAAPQCMYLAFDPDRSGPLSSMQEFTLECETNIKLLLTNLRESNNLYEQVELLSTLVRLQGFDFDTGLGQPDEVVTVARLLDELYAKAGQLKLWAIVRRVAGLYDKMDMSLADAVTDILVRQKQISVGRSYSEASLITRPLTPSEIMDKIREFCREDIRDRVLTQEILIYLSLLIKSEPRLFNGLLTLRVGFLILLITSELARERDVPQDEAYEDLMQLSPHDIQTRLHQVLVGYEGLDQSLFRQESLHVRQQEAAIEWVVLPEAESLEEDWWRKRQLDGSVNRVPKNFYPSVWTVLKHCSGLVIGDKLERRNRLESDLLLEMTPGEKNFALRVEHLLNKIQAPEYRQVNVEALMELAAIAERNPALQIEEYIVLDVLVGHAVRLAWLDQHPNHRDRYAEHKAAAWRSFYATSPYLCASYVAKALQFLTELGHAEDIGAA
ncbi:glycoside hydrolase family 15 protein [Leptolyngbya sp. FACHB-36]|uniref:glycoside hydrolase family 15 protein n=1 Tax=Leptolyngbya sp. FACHB-36 TaxID=2692808 RepID=UPI00168014BF|nr:glycoside hydrolase family 15 protein [Leptolyngbya sp. FACHB-36]MBD2019795.1 glycoside hydrolase family 15 protein [Leptolyngbya sp. FACHB-36]